MGESWEIWKRYGKISKITNGLYQVSNLGNIRNYKSNRILKSCKDKDGYLLIGLHKNHKLKTVRIHRLVAKSFIPNLENKPQVNHKDGNKQNNNVDNLEWCTMLENIKHAWKNGLMKIHYGKGKNSKKAKIIYQIDPKTNKIINIYHGNRDVERKTGYDHSSISKCCRNRKSYKTYGGYKWQYAEGGEKDG